MSSHPNILIFMTDQQRWDVTEPGHPCKTPNLDRMVREGIRFRNVYPPMAHCCPARASFMTGLYPSQHGVWNNVYNESRLNEELKPGIECWSEKLCEAGYAMYYSGKWHVSTTKNPSDYGWSEGFITAAALPDFRGGKGMYIEDWSNCDWPDTPPESRKNGQILKPGWGDWWLYGSRETLNENYQSNKKCPWDDDFVDAKILHSGLEQLDKALAGDQPWCQYIGINGPHDPFVIPEHYAKMYDPDDIELPLNWDDTLLDKPEYYRRQKKRFDQLSECEKREAIAYYYGFCTLCDDMFGEALKKIEDAGELDNTLVIFCSDHGELLGNHGIYLKGVAPYEEGYRVPLLLRWPQGIKHSGREITELVSLMDISPTLCDTVGVSNPNSGKTAGLSLKPFFSGREEPAWRDALYMQCNGTEVFFSSRTVRTEKWKFVYNAVAFDELYDLEKDPYELNNLAGNSAYNDIIKDLYAKMWQLALETNDSYLACQYHTVSLADWGPMTGLAPTGNP